MTARTVTYAIHVYPLVLKFLSYHYDTSPFQLINVKNPYASYLQGCLDRYDSREMQLPRKYEQLTARLTIGISKWHIKRCAAGKLSPQKVAAFNDFVKQMFFEKLTTEVAMHTALGLGVKTAIEQFLVRYDIVEEELSIEMAMRYYGRTRRKLLLHNCPVLPVKPAVILSNDRDCANWQMESWRGQVA